MTIKNTHELANGDVIEHHGAIMRLRNRKEWREHPAADPDYAPVITFDTDLLNDGGDIPLSFRRKDFQHHWVVQGNSLATWLVIDDLTVRSVTPETPPLLHFIRRRAFS